MRDTDYWDLAYETMLDSTFVRLIWKFWAPPYDVIMTSSKFKIGITREPYTIQIIWTSHRNYIRFYVYWHDLKNLATPL